MREVEERYISLLADFGFKLIFGMVPNKDLLIYFLNSLFDGRKVIIQQSRACGRHVCRTQGYKCNSHD